MWKPRMIRPLAILIPAGLFVACQSESVGPPIGSAEWYWEAAQHNYAVGDYEKAQDQLERLVATDSDWKSRALPWRATLVGGLARGYLELTDTFGLCASMNAKAAADLQNPIQDWRRGARRHALNFTESVAALAEVSGKHDELVLEFAFPPGRPAKSPLMENIQSGMPPRPDQITSCEDEAIGRGLVLQASMMVDGTGDPAQAQKLFASPPVEVPANLVLCSLAESLVELSAVFDYRHVNEPDKQAHMLDLAMKTLESPLGSEDAEIRKRAEEIKKKVEDSRKSVS